MVPSHPKYDSFLLGIRDSSDWSGFDLIFVEDQKYLESWKELTRRDITGDIRKIVLFYYPNNAVLRGLRFYDADGKLIYESSWKGAFTNPSFKQHEILLNEGERIIGYKSDILKGLHGDFQFIIGRTF